MFLSLGFPCPPMASHLSFFEAVLTGEDAGSIVGEKRLAENGEDVELGRERERNPNQNYSEGSGCELNRNEERGG
ncbi:unnamed protein product [Camellia sinensis]